MFSLNIRQWPLHVFVLSLYTLTSVSIFCILFSAHFQRCWQGEFLKQSIANLFPINDNTSIIHLKLLVWSESKHFTCSFFSRFKIKSFWFANSVQFVTYTINYRDAYRQYLSASCWLVFQNINCSLSSAPHRPWIAVLRVIRQKYLERNPGLVKYNDTSKLKLSNKQVMVILKLVR